jgi:hypothetical protein
MIPTMKDVLDTLPNSITDYNYEPASGNELLSRTFSNACYHAMWQARGARLLKLARELEDTRQQRDALARRCAEQAKHIAGLLELQAEDAADAERHPLADAIAAMQRAGVR